MAIIRLAFDSRVTQHREKVTVFYPDVLKKRSYHGPKQEGEIQSPGDGKGYQVLYLIYGGGGDDLEWLAHADLTDWLERKNLVVVMPTIVDHLEELQIGNDLEYLTEELMPYISQLFPVSTKREDTWLAGFSLCGYFVWRVGLLFPHLFHSVCSLCAPIDILGDIRERGSAEPGEIEKIEGTSRDLLYLTEKKLREGEKLPGLFQAFGTEDFARGVNLHAVSHFEKIGLPNYEWHELPGAHNHVTGFAGLKMFVESLSRTGSTIPLS